MFLCLGLKVWDCQPAGVVYVDVCDVCRVLQSLHVCSSVWLSVWVSWCVIEVALQCFWDDDEMLETSIGDVIVEAQCLR